MQNESFNIPALMKYIAPLAQDYPNLYNMLIGSMSISPSVDPEAGFGAMQTIYILYSRDASTEDFKTLNKINNAYELYVFLRALSLLYRDPALMLNGLKRGKTMRYVAMAKHIKSVCKEFNLARVTRELTHANSSKSIRQVA
jgi:hypothetical protein